MAKKTETITLNPITIIEKEITIVGDSDLVLNKMNDVTTRDLMDERKDKAKKKESPNIWEMIITALHWQKPLDKSEVDSWDNETMMALLTDNKPAISAFGMYKSFGDAVVRYEIDTYSTKFFANVQLFGVGDGLIPISFSDWTLDEKLMSPKRGAPVLARLNRFSNWSATFTIRYIDGGKYSLEQIVNIINLAGFGLGIGSGRKAGYGRYHVSEVR